MRYSVGLSLWEWTTYSAATCRARQSGLRYDQSRQRCCKRARWCNAKPAINQWEGVLIGFVYGVMYRGVLCDKLGFCAKLVTPNRAVWSANVRLLRTVSQRLRKWSVIPAKLLRGRWSPPRSKFTSVNVTRSNCQRRITCFWLMTSYNANVRRLLLANFLRWLASRKCIGCGLSWRQRFEVRLRYDAKVTIIVNFSAM